MPCIIPSSVGALIVGLIALILGIFQTILSVNLEKDTWNKWGSAISFIIFVHAIIVFIQFYLKEVPLNLICEQIQLTNFVLMVYACYRFTVHYLVITPFPHHSKIVLIHTSFLFMIWTPEWIIEYEFVHRNFIWLSRPYIEPILTLPGKLLILCLGFFGLYILKLWYQYRDKAGIETRLFMTGFGIMFLFCVHDLACAFGLTSVQYLNIFGFFGFFMTIIGITIIKYINVHQALSLSTTALESSKKDLEQKVKDRTFKLLNGNMKLQAAVDQLRQSEKRIYVLSSQTEQFSLAAASMLVIGNENQFFKTISDAIVSYSDYNRVLISIFKPSPPYRDIIGHGGVDPRVIDRLKTVDMPAGYYDHVFDQGHKVGRQSYYIPHTMKHILNQPATIYGEGPVPDNENTWHPEDNLFVKMLNEKGEFIGVISVDDSKSGRRPTDETVRPLEIFSSLISQIIIFKKEQKKRRELEEELMMARRMDSIGRLAGGIAHDFNNLLGIIIGKTELAMKKAPVSAGILMDLQAIKLAGDKATNIVKQLLSFGRKSELSLIPLDMAGVLADLLGLIRLIMPASIEINTHFHPENSVIMGDSIQIHQIFLNLCLNAAQAMEQTGGTIELSCHVVDLSENQIHPYNGLTPGKHIDIKVSDTGPGINPDIIDRIFDPYFTTKDTGKGSGIGLSVVHGIVSSHHGRIQVKSRPGEGTTFDIWFPVVDHQPQSIEPQKESCEKGQQESILIVDDDPMILEVITEIISQLGYHGTGVLYPEKALALFQDTPDLFDLVITDMTMPHMSGITFTRKIQEISPHKPVIICTGYSETIHGKTAEELNVAALLMKPVQIKTLTIEINKALKKGIQDRNQVLQAELSAV